MPTICPRCRVFLETDEQGAHCPNCGDAYHVDRPPPADTVRERWQALRPQ